MSRAAYEIRASGVVPPRFLEDFDGVTIAPDPAGTTIRADLADEAELHGLLDALRREGFLLVDVRREPVYDGPGVAAEQASPDGPGGSGGPASAP